MSIVEWKSNIGWPFGSWCYYYIQNIGQSATKNYFSTVVRHLLYSVSCCCWFCLLILFICKFSINHPLKMSLSNQQIAFPNIYSAFRLSDRPFKVVKFANKFLFSSSLFFLRAHFNHVIISIGLIEPAIGQTPLKTVLLWWVFFSSSENLMTFSCVWQCSNQI